jgi:hypothetical protein
MSEKVKKKISRFERSAPGCRTNVACNPNARPDNFPKKKKEFLLMNSVIQQFGKVEKREIT